MSAPDPGLEVLERRVRRCQSRLLPIARAILFWERLWPRLWPIVGISGLFVSLSLLDFFPLLPYWLHVISLAGIAAMSGWVLVSGLRGFRAPSQKEARNRIERDSGLRHRPLAALDDTSVSDGDKFTAGTTGATGVTGATGALWHEHRRRAAQASERLGVDPPSPGMARHDPYGFRAMVLLLLVISGAAGFGDAGARMARALVPEDRGADAEVRVDVWVTPPAYTGYPPFHVFRSDNNSGDVTPGQNDDWSGEMADEREGENFVELRTIIVGSSIFAQVGGAPSPSLILGNRKVDFEPIWETGGRAGGGQGFRLETSAKVSDVIGDEAPDADTITITSGKQQLAAWPVRIVDDLPPKIEFTQAPSNGGRGRLRVAFAAEDDFGLSGATLVIRNPKIPADSIEGDTVKIDLPLSGLGLGSGPGAGSGTRSGTLTIETAVVRDLSEHDWTGLVTDLRLETSDALGQIGRSDAITMVLPERIFNHPVARALAGHRKLLVAPPPENVDAAIVALDDLSSRPEHFSHDKVVYLAMRVARARLMYDGAPGVMKSVRRLLWDTALRIEDGEFALAGRELSEIQDALEQALRDGAYPDAVDELLNTLRNALERFLAALDEQLNEKGMEGLSDIPGLSYLDAQNLKQMIEDARELARTGSTDAAQATLEELRSLLQSIQSAMESDQPTDQFAEIRKMMEQLSGVSRDQQDLLDQTFQQLRRSLGSEGDPASDGGMTDDGAETGALPAPDGMTAQDATRGFAPAQEGLRQVLGELMRNIEQLLGQPSPAIGEAESAMGGAAGSLRAADPGRAVGFQTDAMDALRRATEQVAEQISRHLRAMPGGMAGSRGATMPNTGNDPFGRMGSGASGMQMDDGSVKVPSQMEMRRAREIYEELRRRAGNLKRPVLEREYIHRLLRQF